MYQISYTLNGHKSATLHCIQNLKRYSNRSLYADSIRDARFLLRCVKAELCHGKIIDHRSEYNSSDKNSGNFISDFVCLDN